MRLDPLSAHRRMWPYWVATGVAVSAGGGWLWQSINKGVEVPVIVKDNIGDSSNESTPQPPVSGSPDPAIDLVRIEPDGSALVVGRAVSGSKVTVLIDGMIITRAKADADGNFVIFLDLAISAQPRVMWLRTESPNGEVLTSADSVILAPQNYIAIPPVPVTPDQALPSIVLVQNSPGDPSLPDRLSDRRNETVSREVIVAMSAARDGQTLPQAVLPAPGGVAPVAPVAIARVAVADLSPPSGADAPPVVTATPPRVLLSTPDGVQVLDSPPLAPTDQIRLDTLSYADDSAVVLRGRSQSEGSVQAYLDNRPVADGTADADGKWTLRLTDVAPGDYTLRVDVTGPLQGVSGRVEIPFRRESAAVLARALDGDTVRAITVQPGATLWAIARTRYGDATRYVQVFEANRDQIGDPDLIFPGQVFGLPDLGVGEVPRP